MALQSIHKTPFFEMFKKHCIENGFTQRGKAFFRVIGDGILQVLKFEYERMGPHYSLDMGLFSMYDTLLEQWFTSGGCIPRYSVMKLVGWWDTSRLGLIGIDSLLFYTLPLERWFASPEEQLDVLVTKGFSYLDKIVTQQRLAQAICDLDKMPKGSIRWNDTLKFTPFLYAGQKENALRVIDAILYQHKDAMQSWKEHFDPDEFEVLRAEQEEKDQVFLDWRDMIINNDENAIAKFFQENYERNLRYAKFCVRKKKR